LGFEDLPEESLAALASMAQLTRLAMDEELIDFGAALVTHGAVSVVTEISDEPALIATKGDVVFTEGSLADGTKLRVVCTGANTVVATWTKSQLKEALKDSPWVRDALRQLADRFQALAGTTLGILGEKLDAALRRSVTDRMEVRSYAPGELVITKGVGMPGLFIVCAGRVDIDNPQAGADHYLSGDFLFPEAVLAAAPTPATARAGAKGALLLFAGKHIVHELVTSVPVLLEALVS
jgi:signal-transduction protein with cAMP-binding, CBS, and nucleotidyltransferase domain